MHRLLADKRRAQRSHDWPTAEALTRQLRDMGVIVTDSTKTYRVRPPARPIAPPTARPPSTAADPPTTSPTATPTATAPPMNALPTAATDRLASSVRQAQEEKQTHAPTALAAVASLLHL